jgi:hypothetical protein
MTPELVQMLEPHVAAVLKTGGNLDLAVRSARVRAFYAGTYAGEPCDNCERREPGLWQWKRPTDGTVWRLCHPCSVVFKQKYPESGGPASRPELDPEWELAFRHLLEAPQSTESPESARPASEPSGFERPDTILPLGDRDYVPAGDLWQDQHDEPDPDGPPAMEG